MCGVLEREKWSVYLSGRRGEEDGNNKRKNEWGGG